MISVYKFSSKTCPPCLRLKPIYEAVKKDYSNRITFKEIDVDEDIITPNRFNIRAIPVISILKNNEEMERIEGFVNEEKLRIIIKKYI